MPLACVLILAESWPVGVAAVAVPEPPTRDLSAADGPVLCLPAPELQNGEDLAEAAWLIRAMGHGRPVSGGATGWVPPFTQALRLKLAACERGESEAPDVLDAWRDQQRGRWVEVYRGHRDGRAEFWERALTQIAPNRELSNRRRTTVSI